MGIRCQYCGDKYNEELVNRENQEESIGGFVDDVWFCGWCIKHGLEEYADSEEERKELLRQEAEDREFA